MGWYLVSCLENLTSIPALEPKAESQSKPMWSHMKPWPGLRFNIVQWIRYQKSEEPNDFPGALVLGSDPPQSAPRSPGVKPSNRQTCQSSRNRQASPHTTLRDSWPDENSNSTQLESFPRLELLFTSLHWGSHFDLLKSRIQRLLVQMNARSLCHVSHMYDL